MQQCEELIDKVGEFRYLKVRERQINEFNNLLQKQKGNITYYKKGNITCTSNPLNLSQGKHRCRQCLNPPSGLESQSK